MKYPIDEYEFDREVIHHFVSRNKPILGICGGMQGLNVYFGGTLHQRIPGHNTGLVTHPVTVKEDSFLYRVHGRTQMDVNSFHMQAVDDLAPGFAATAVSEDGIIEAMEKDNIVAFQWHPEVMYDRQLFGKFVKDFF